MKTINIVVPNFFYEPSTYAGLWIFMSEVGWSRNIFCFDFSAWNGISGFQKKDLARLLTKILRVKIKLLEEIYFLRLLLVFLVETSIYRVLERKIKKLAVQFTKLNQP